MGRILKREAVYSAVWHLFKRLKKPVKMQVIEEYLQRERLYSHLYTLERMGRVKVVRSHPYHVAVTDICDLPYRGPVKWPSDNGMNDFGFVEK